MPADVHADQVTYVPRSPGRVASGRRRADQARKNAARRVRRAACM